MRDFTKRQISREILDVARRTIERVRDRPYENPFFVAILSEEVLRLSQFERSFSTSWGQRAIEEMARIIAVDAGRIAARPKDTRLDNVSQPQLDLVNEIVESLRQGVSPDWVNEVDRVLKAPSAPRPNSITSVRSDLWVSDVGGGGLGAYFSIKTAKPNIDQTAVAKSDMLRIVAQSPDAEVYFALPYNPMGENRFDYTWKFPFTIFDMRTDESVLIGKEFWDYLGGDGCYEELLQVCEEVGPEVRAMVEAV